MPKEALTILKVPWPGKRHSAVTGNSIECTQSLYHVDTTHGSIGYRVPALTSEIAETLLPEEYGVLFISNCPQNIENT